MSAAWINAHGGINGHPLEEKFCDSKGTPTGGATCAHQAVADHAVAVVGSFNATGGVIVPILAAAKIAYFGNCCAIAPIEFTSPDSFLIGDEPLGTVGLVYRAVKDGCKSIGAVMYQGTEVYEPLINAAAKTLGAKPIKYVSLPASATEDSSEAAQATSGTDCLLLIVPEGSMSALIPALVQTGVKERFYGPEGNLDPTSVKGYEGPTSGSVVQDFGYTDDSLPAWADYRSALSQYHADPTLNYDTPGGKGTWIGYQGFVQVAKTISGPITNASFLAAASKATISIPGAIPDIDFAKPWGATGGPPAFARVVNTDVAFGKLENGKEVPYISTFTNVENLVLGKPLQ